MSLPASSRPPGPTAIISPCDGFSWALSGMKMPPADFVSASIRSITTRSCSGRNFISALQWFDWARGFQAADRHCPLRYEHSLSLSLLEDGLTMASAFDEEERAPQASVRTLEHGC